MKILNLKFLDKNNNFDNNLSKDNKAKDVIYPPIIKEWNNSIFTYNKNKYKNILFFENFIQILIKGYFNMYTKILVEKVKLPLLKKRNRRNLGNKIWISKIETKHTNDTITINIYLYNRKINFLIRKLKLILLKFYQDKILKTKNNVDYLNFSKKTIFALIINTYNEKITTLLNKFNKQEKGIYNKINVATYYSFLYKFIYIKYIKEIFKKELYIFYYKQYISHNLYINKNIYILPLKKLISKIYNKNIKFNIITLKNFHLDSNITSQIIATKAIKRNNRIIKLLKKTLIKVNVPTLSKNLISKEKKILSISSNNTIKNNKNLLSTNNNIEKYLENNYTIYKKNNIDQNVLKSMNNRIVIGIRLKASGRLTRRFTAQRSIYKLRYKGTLKNVNSAYKGISSKLIRNNIGSNIQYTKIISKNRIGAFGIKGWINSM